MSVGATVIVSGVAAVEVPMFTLTLGVEFTSNVTGVSIDIIAFVVPDDVVDGRITNVVVVDVSYMDVVSSIDEDTCVSSKDEIFVIFDDFDD